MPVIGETANLQPLGGDMIPAIGFRHLRNDPWLIGAPGARHRPHFSSACHGHATRDT
jgi:hypothetical protein